MPKNNAKKMSKASRNYYFNILTLFPFLLLLFSGIIVLRYHGGTDYNISTLSLSGHQWLKLHQVVALVVIPLIGLHLWLHKYWLKALFSFKKKNKSKNNDLNIGLLLIFFSCVVTALLAWVIVKDEKLADLLREVHNKLGLALIFFFIIHLANYYKWLVKMTRKKLGKKTEK